MKVWQYTLRRLALLVPVLLGVSLFTFSMAWFATDGHLENQYIRESDRLSEEQIELIRERYGFDKPWYLQYVSYLENLLRGDLGYSSTANRPVADALGDFLPASAELALLAMLFAVVLGVPLGVLSAARRDQAADHVTRFLALSGVSVPVFWLALILQLFLAFQLGQAGIDLFPLSGRFDANLVSDHPSLVDGPTGFLLIDTALALDAVAWWDAFRHLLLPAFTLCFVTLAIIGRMMRSSMLEVLGTDYVKTARSKGLEEKVVLNRHARRNALIPTTTVIGLSVGGLINGAVLTETVFAWPGLGRWSTRAILSVDVAAIMTFVVVTALIYVLANLLVDVLYAYLDPRVRLE